MLFVGMIYMGQLSSRHFPAFTNLHLENRKDVTKKREVSERQAHYNMQSLDVSE